LRIETKDELFTERNKKELTMTLKRRSHASLKLAAMAILAASAAHAADLPNNAVYASTTATLSYTTFVGPIPIDGLSITLPAASQAYNTAIVTLSMPNLYLSAPTSTTEAMSAEIQVVAPFSPAGVVSAFGGIGCDTPKVTTSGKKPITIVIEVPLGTTSQPAEAEWDSTNGTVTTDRFASISAVLVRE
jgi:hypothetical protein